MQAKISWQGEARFAATSGSGHTVVVDGPPEHGGKNQGVRPMELMLLGAGSCSAFDVVHLLKKMRQPVTGCDVNIDSKRAEMEPKVFTEIHMHFVVSGDGLDPKKVERAIELSATKYCSASIMLAKTANITHDFEIMS